MQLNHIDIHVLAIITFAVNVVFLLFLFYRNIRKEKAIYSEQDFPASRRKLSEVKPGEFINIEHKNAALKIIRVKVVNNDSITRKMFLFIDWDRSDLAKCEIFSYDDYVFRNFHLLNQILKDEQVAKNEEQDNLNLIELNRKLKQAIDGEEFEKARIIQSKIDKICQS